MVATMADPIYGIQASQPYDVFSYMKSKAPQLQVVGRTSFLPNLLNSADLSFATGIDFVISGNVLYYDEPLMDGQSRRYSKIRAFVSDFTPGRTFSSAIDNIAIVEEGIARLGYTDLTVLNVFENSTALASAYGVLPSRLSAPLAGAELVEFKAGVPSYTGPKTSIDDAPLNGQVYVRVNGAWVVDTHDPHSDINGGTATVS